MERTLQFFIDKTPSNWAEMACWSDDELRRWHKEMDFDEIASLYSDILSHPQVKTLVEKWEYASPTFIVRMTKQALKQHDFQAIIRDILSNKHDWNDPVKLNLAIAYLTCLEEENNLPMPQYQILLSEQFHPLMEQVIKKNRLKFLLPGLALRAPEKTLLLLDHPLLGFEEKDDLLFYLHTRTTPKQLTFILRNSPPLLQHFSDFVQRNKHDYSVVQNFVLTREKQWEPIRDLLFSQKLKNDLLPSSPPSPQKKM